MNQEDAKYLLTTLSNVFEQNGIQLMLAYGTLLGAIREHNFIAHDTDIDVMIFAKDRDNALSLQEELKKYGIELWCYVLPWIFTFKYKLLPAMLMFYMRQTVHGTNNSIFCWKSIFQNIFSKS